MSCNPFFTPISIYSIYLSIYMSTYLSVYLTNLLYLMLSPIIKYYSINLSHLLSLLLSLESSLLPRPPPVVGHARGQHPPHLKDTVSRDGLPFFL